MYAYFYPYYELCVWKNKVFVDSVILTTCSWATQNCVIASQCVVDRSHISAFSYMTSCACICQLVWLTYRFKVIDSLMQDAWVWGYKQTDQSWWPVFRTIRLQQRDHSFRYSLSFPSVAIMALRRNALQEDNILCELYADTRYDISVYSDNESLDSDSDSPQLVHANNCNLLLVHWPPNFQTHFCSHLSRQFL
jgi:hypothetical protein